MSVFVNNYYNVEDLQTTEKEKSEFNYLKKSADYYISTLVRQKPHIKKARNLYDGLRDKEEFKYLEETFGIETPIAVKMTPLIKTRIDVLLGLLLDDVFTYNVSINDHETIAKVENSRKEERAKRILAAYRTQFANNAQRVQNGEEPQKTVTDRYLERVEQAINEEFISQFEIACMSLINFFEQDVTLDFKQKIKQFFLDLLITGEAYYRTHFDRIGGDPILTICKPENIFFSKRTDNQFLSSGYRPHSKAVVHRTWMKRSDILNQYGHMMNESAKKRIFGEYSRDDGARRIADPRTLDYIYRMEDGADYTQWLNDDMDVLPVYHVEWLANNEVKIDDTWKEFNDPQDRELVEKIKASKYWTEAYGEGTGSGTTKKKAYRLDRYEVTRIGDDIYLNCGKSKYIPRSAAQPWTTTLSYNGVAYNDRNDGRPYSLALALKNLQDSYDIIMFFRDNLIANAGVDGSRINLAAIPKVLGQDYMERILKFMAFRKQGVELYDPTEDGAALFQHYGDFRGSLSGNIIESLNTVLESIQMQADVVSGVNRHMYAAAEVRDAVTNVQVGQKQVSLITKDLFELVHTSRKHMLTDLINRAKITYKKGKRGSYIVGHRQILFDVQPAHFCFTDYNIHVVNSSKENLKLEKVNAIVPELVAQGALDPNVIIKITMSDSPTEILRIVEKNLIKKEMENDQLQQMNQQLEQAMQQAQQMEAEMQKAQKQIEALEKASDDIKARELQLREQEIQGKLDNEDRRIKLDTHIAEEEIQKDKMIVQLEREQLYAEGNSGGGNAKEVRNDI